MHGWMVLVLSVFVEVLVVLVVPGMHRWLADEMNAILCMEWNALHTMRTQNAHISAGTLPSRVHPCRLCFVPM